MPILEIQVVGTPPDSARHDLARRLAEAVGEVLGAKPQTVWVKVQYLSLDEYAGERRRPRRGRSAGLRESSARPPAGAGRLAVRGSDSHPHNCNHLCTPSGERAHQLRPSWGRPDRLRRPPHRVNER